MYSITLLLVTQVTLFLVVKYEEMLSFCFLLFFSLWSVKGYCLFLCFCISWGEMEAVKFKMAVVMKKGLRVCGVVWWSFIWPVEFKAFPPSVCSPSLPSFFRLALKSPSDVGDVARGGCPHRRPRDSLSCLHHPPSLTQMLAFCSCFISHSLKMLKKNISQL
jgi:hypothetical protein